MWQRTFPKSDVEAGAQPLYPMMLESPQLRWAFIRKIYSIVAIQLLLTIAVAAVVVTVHPIAHFFVSTGAGLALYIVLIFVPFIGMFGLLLFFLFLLLWTCGLTFWFLFWNLNHRSFVPVVLLLPTASSELSASWSFYYCSVVRCWIDMCIHKW